MAVRYPYAPAGRIAAAIFFVAALILVWLVASRFHHTPPFVIAPIMAVVAALASFVVFSSHAERRPLIVWQGAMADGVIAGIISAVITALIIVFVSTGAGTASGPSADGVAGGIGLGIVAGFLIGAVLGLLALAIGGPTRLERVPPRPPKPASAKRGKRARRKR